MCARAKRSGVSRSHEGRRQSSRTWVFLVGLDSPPPWGGRVVLQMGPPVWGGGVPSGSEVIFDLPFSPICPPPIPQLFCPNVVPSAHPWHRPGPAGLPASALHTAPHADLAELRSAGRGALLRTRRCSRCLPREIRAAERDPGSCAVLPPGGTVAWQRFSARRPL